MNSHRIFICIGGRCAPYDEADRLQRRLQAWCDAGSATPVACIRSGCLRICEEGPLLVVDPGDYMYSHVNLATAKRIVTEHIEGGKTIPEKFLDLRGPSTRRK